VKIVCYLFLKAILRDINVKKIIMPLLVEGGDFEVLKHQPWYQAEVIVFSPGQLDDSKQLSGLVFKILRQPNDLLVHLQRIYFCYQKKWNEHLFAALLDLLMILAGRGQALAHRMVFGCRIGITDDQFLSLKTYLQQSKSIKLATNPYAVLASGQQGTSRLVSYSQQTHIEHDPIKLALDYIEYSQLEEAMAVLEGGFHQLPDREDIQELLLEIYQSTQSRERFLAMYLTLNGLNTNQVASWDSVKMHFDAQSS
jgi:hypothetical protein